MVLAMLIVISVVLVVCGINVLAGKKVLRAEIGGDGAIPYR